jgi:hypothetical protein
VLQLKLVCCIACIINIPNPTIVLSIPETVPVNVGEAKLPLNLKQFEQQLKLV